MAEKKHTTGHTDATGSTHHAGPKDSTSEHQKHVQAGHKGGVAPHRCRGNECHEHKETK